MFCSKDDQKLALETLFLSLEDSIFFFTVDSLFCSNSRMQIWYERRTEYFQALKLNLIELDRGYQIRNFVKLFFLKNCLDIF